MSCGCTKSKKNCYTPCKCSSCCPEPCTPRVSCERICTALVADNSWNIPACDAYAVVSFPGLQTVMIGAYLTNPTYGTFLITGFNSINGEVTIQNPCFPDNADPGTTVAALTEFVYSAGPTLTTYTDDWTPVVIANGGTDNLTTSGL